MVDVEFEVIFFDIDALVEVKIGTVVGIKVEVLFGFCVVANNVLATVVAVGTLSDTTTSVGVMSSESVD